MKLPNAYSNPYYITIIVRTPFPEGVIQALLLIVVDLRSEKLREHTGAVKTTRLTVKYLKNVGGNVENAPERLTPPNTNVAPFRGLTFSADVVA